MGIKKLLGIGTKPGPTELLIRAAVLLIVKRLQGVEMASLRAMKEMEARIMATLDDLVAKVAEFSSVTSSTAAFIDGLQDKLDAALKQVKEGYEPEKLIAIIDGLEKDKLALIEAMKENTIAVVEPTPPPVTPDPVVEPAPGPVVDAAPVVEEPAPAPEPAPAEAPKLDEWGNPIS